ncbi:GumC family protein [Litorivivens sp.]|uniref:GumC family protein n=1 Tax=Litorivivens sp. TaxID=2020868 RepID=UPI003568D02D
MSDYTPIPDELAPVPYRRPVDKPRWARYIFVALAVFMLIWTMVAAYVLSSPTYSSKFSFVLPGKGVNTKVNLQSIGEASTSSNSPFGNSGINPRVNYKEILVSDLVVRRAADALGIEIQNFGKPTVKLVDQTAIIHVANKGSSPEAARNKSEALVEAFNSRIEELRTDEMERREEGIRRALSVYQQRLDDAQDALLEHKQNSQYVSARQYEELTMRLERLKEEQVRTTGERDNISGYVQQLSMNLGITPRMAANAFMLQADSQFSRNLDDYQEASANLAVYRSKWGGAHPAIVKEQAKQESTLDAMRQRSLELIGEQDLNILRLINISSSNERGTLFQDLLVNFAKAKGLNDKIDQLGKAIERHVDNLKRYAREAAELENLERDYEIAEAVYTSAVTQIDTSKTDVFASYPLVQVLAAPSLPTKPVSPNKPLAIIGGVLGSMMTLFGLFLLWKRKQLIQKILSKSGFGTL